MITQFKIAALTIGLLCSQQLFSQVNECQYTLRLFFGDIDIINRNDGIDTFFKEVKTFEGYIPFAEKPAIKAGTDPFFEPFIDLANAKDTFGVSYMYKLMVYGCRDSLLLQTYCNGTLYSQGEYLIQDQLQIDTTLFIDLNTFMDSIAVRRYYNVLAHGFWSLMDTNRDICVTMKFNKGVLEYTNFGRYGIRYMGEEKEQQWKASKRQKLRDNALYYKEFGFSIAEIAETLDLTEEQVIELLK